jgi:hypothetical protein
MTFARKAAMFAAAATPDVKAPHKNLFANQRRGEFEHRRGPAQEAPENPRREQIECKSISAAVWRSITGRHRWR